MNQKGNYGISLGILILLTIWFLQGYGIWVSNMGYSNLMVQGYGEKVALAVLAIRDGFVPWNVLPGESSETGSFYYGENRLSHSSYFAAAGFAEEIEHWGLQEIVEQERMTNERRLTTEYVTDHLLRHTLLEEMIEYNDMAGVFGEEDSIPSLVFTTVDDSYFADAVFIGDSRMQGVYEYAGMEEADFLAKVSMTIYNMMNTKVSTNGHNETIREALTKRQYGKIYIMVGINELGTADTEYFIRHYQAVLEEIRTLQPDALIVIQAIMHVTGEKDREDPIFNNTNINERNEALKELANGQNIFYIDVNEVYDDENGNLRREMSADDVHLLGNCYELWHTFFLEHGIVYGSFGEE
ncbi:MAG: hypothetical protein K2K96_12555 [Lachnospiraceae bacterium]|nr:hypothetical protein [Lachnospiraceae bacterium]